MRRGANIAVIIPAFNEEEAISKVISAIPEWVDDIVVVDNGSSDATTEVARKSGARVVFEPKRGYGSACLAGIESVKAPDILVFLDGDFSDYPEEMDRLVDPIIAGQAEMVIGSRVRGSREKGALTPQARFGNWLSCLLIRLFWGVEYSDLGPFRTIAYPALNSLGMRDPNYGWTVEMQIRAATKGIQSIEVPVSYRKRIGKSKVSGTVRGVIFAGTKILFTIFKSVIEPSSPHEGRGGTGQT
jgi:glycosyltransferase involved in cell wall biosynthesis